jgi:hypothetical protein
MLFATTGWLLQSLSNSLDKTTGSVNTLGYTYIVLDEVRSPQGWCGPLFWQTSAALSYLFESGVG